jgi:two-component system response regulator (stage 0 sporulation protein F)
MTQKSTLLYVDDEALNLLLFKMNFEKFYIVITCESGKEALEKIKQDSSIRVVISDMKMPHMNGIEFIQKAREFAPGLFYYILTGFEITDEIQEALDNDLIRKYFQKPFNVKEITQEVDACLLGNQL